MSIVPRLLYVDSDTTRADASAEILSTEFEFEVYTAKDMPTAITMLELHSIDCAVSEFKLTDDNGFELLSHIRSVNRYLPVILVVDDVPEAVSSEAFESGMTELVHRAEIADSYAPLVDRLHDLLAEAPDDLQKTKSPTEPLTDTAAATTTGSQLGAVSMTTEDLNPKASDKELADAVIDGVSIPNPTRSELQTLTKDQLITLVLQFSSNPDSPTISFTETDEVSPPTEEADQTTAGVATREAVSSSEASLEPPSGEDGYLSQLDLSPGTTILIQCNSQPSRKYEVHQALLGGVEESSRNVLLIRYRPLPEAQLESIATTAKRITILTIRCSQSVPKTVSAIVETIRIGRITELRRLGILTTRVVNRWEPLHSGVSVSIDPLDNLFNHKTVKDIFRFLHVLLGKLSSQGAVTQVHITQSAVDDQSSNIIKPLFDHTLVVDSQDVSLDSDPE